jgi:hypothetical protein
MGISVNCRDQGRYDERDISCVLKQIAAQHSCQEPSRHIPVQTRMYFLLRFRLGCLGV